MKPHAVFPNLFQFIVQNSGTNKHNNISLGISAIRKKIIKLLTEILIFRELR